MTEFAEWWRSYWYEAMPPRRLRLVSIVVYFAVAFTVFVSDRWAAVHADVPSGLYRPVWLARTVGLPAPNVTTMALLQIVLAVCCVAGFVGRSPRAVGAVTFAAYVVWLLWAFSYGKVDHDRLTVVVALAVLATTDVRGAHAHTRSGYGLRMIQVVFALAYPLSALAKLRYGGVAWMDGATFARAIIRRGTALGDLMLHAPWLLRVSQWGFVIFELFATCLLFRKGRLRNLALIGVLMLHVVTFSMITISFLPHSVLLAAFLPLERWFPGRPTDRTPAPCSPEGTSATPHP